MANSEYPGGASSAQTVLRHVPGQSEQFHASCLGRNAIGECCVSLVRWPKPAGRRLLPEQRQCKVLQHGSHCLSKLFAQSLCFPRHHLEVLGGVLLSSGEPLQQSVPLSVPKRLAESTSESDVHEHEEDVLAHLHSFSDPRKTAVVVVVVVAGTCGRAKQNSWNVSREIKGAMSLITASDDKDVRTY